MERDLGSGGPARREPGASALWAIWGSMLASLAVYAIVGLVAAPRVQSSPGVDAQGMVVPVLGFLAAAQIVAVFVLRAALARRLTYTAWCVVRWAVAESAGVYGLVAALLGAEVAVTAAFIVGAAVVLVLWRPGPGAEEGHRQLRQ